MTSEYDVFVSDEVKSFLARIDEKSERICRDNLAKLSTPFPGRGYGDKEKIPYKGRETYRLHIARTWTAFYDIVEKEKQVKVWEILPIDDAHKKYGR